MTCTNPIVPNPYQLKWMVDVDADQIGAGKILVVDQNCIHNYMDPCDVLAWCQGLYQNFLDLLDCPHSYSWQGNKILRVNWAGNGVEFADALSIFTWLWWTDQYVKTNASDPIAGYLFDKISVGQWIQKSVVWDTVNLAVNVTTMPSVMTTFTQLSDVPNSYVGSAGDILRVNSGANWLEFAPAALANPPRGRRYMLNDEVYSFPLASPYEYAVWLRNFIGFKWNSDAMRNQSLLHNLWWGNTTNVLTVPATGIYKVVLKWTIACNSGVMACRVALVSSTWTNIVAACDSKFGDQTFNPGDYTDQLRYFDFWKEMLLRLTTGTQIYAILIVYNWFPSGRGPTPAPTNSEVVVLHQNVIGWGIDDRWTAFEISRFGTDDWYIDA